MKEKETFEQICYKFKENITSIFNEEQRIPFLLKYYLIKDIWDKIQQHKKEVDTEIREKILLQQDDQKQDVLEETVQEE